MSQTPQELLQQLIRLSKKLINENYAGNELLFIKEACFNDFNQKLIQKQPILEPKIEQRPVKPQLKPALAKVMTTTPKKKLKEEASNVSLRPLKSNDHYTIDDVKEAFLKVFHGFELCDEEKRVPCVSQKKNLALPDKDCEVLVLYIKTDTSDAMLLQNMTHAINEHLAKATIIDTAVFEKDQHWEALFNHLDKLKLLLISEVHLYQLPRLMNSFDLTAGKTLKGTPLFLLADIKAYNIDKSLKHSLWASLKQIFSVS